MLLTSLLLFLSLRSLAYCSSGSEWCYNGCDQTPEHWKDIPGAFCGGQRQSPINIVLNKVVTNPNLHNLMFANFSSNNTIKSVINNGHTVKFILREGAVEVSGGGLGGTYSALQFHFHWGTSSKIFPGSEHTINDYRYPMEMHIVSLKKGLSVDEATGSSDGIAAFGFMINGTNNGNKSGAWTMLTSYLTNVTNNEVKLNHNISINDLIGNVNLTKFYRYNGSLTTPHCNEAVVWTIFHEPIEIHEDLIKMFPTKAGFNNIYRPRQEINGRQVYASPATPLPPSHSWCYDTHCDYSPSKWHLLPHSNCGGKRQSPINIKTQDVVENSNLTEFLFKNFDDKRAIKYMINTGHAVKCVLKNDTVEVSEGGLGHVYSVLQFHFHWGFKSDDSEGSEHSVDSKRYPMEMHIVAKRKDLTLEKAIQTPNGLAVLGFFIEAKDTTKSSSGGSTTHPTSSSSSDMDGWKKLTSYLSYIQNISSEINVEKEISIDDLLGDVKRKTFYRYNGSLTTPSCNEAVVWTVFEDSIKVDRSLMMMFPTHAGYNNVFRPAQPINGRTVFKSTSSAPAPILTVSALGMSLCLFHVFLICEELL